MKVKGDKKRKTNQQKESKYNTENRWHSLVDSNNNKGNNIDDVFTKKEEESTKVAKK